MPLPKKEKREGESTLQHKIRQWSDEVKERPGRFPGGHEQAVAIAHEQMGKAEEDMDEDMELEEEETDEEEEEDMEMSTRKALSVLAKAKYTKRTGNPGNYKYEYDADGPQAELDRKYDAAVAAGDGPQAELDRKYDSPPPEVDNKAVDDIVAAHGKAEDAGQFGDYANEKKVQEAAKGKYDTEDDHLSAASAYKDAADKEFGSKERGNASRKFSALQSLEYAHRQASRTLNPPTKEQESAEHAEFIQDLEDAAYRYKSMTPTQRAIDILKGGPGSGPQGGRSGGDGAGGANASPAPGGGGSGPSMGSTASSAFSTGQAIGSGADTPGGTAQPTMSAARQAVGVATKGGDCEDCASGNCPHEEHTSKALTSRSLSIPFHLRQAAYDPDSVRRSATQQTSRMYTALATPVRDTLQHVAEKTYTPEVSRSNEDMERSQRIKKLRTDMNNSVQPRKDPRYG